MSAPKKRSPVVAAAWVLGAAYLFLGRGLLDVFPFTSLPMYAGTTGRDVARLVAVDAAGTAHRVYAFTSWTCDPFPGPETPPCDEAAPRPYSIGYVERDETMYMRDHAGTADDARAEPLRIVRRIWHLEDRSGPPAFDDCEITRCRAVRK